MLKDAIDLHRQGRLDEAENGYRARLDDHPNDVDALHLLGLLRHQRGDVAEGMRLIARAHDLAPEDAGIEQSLASLHFRSGDYDAAHTGYERALSLDPNLAAAHSGIGQIALLRGEIPRAEQHFRIALRAGEDAQALAGLGAALLERGDTDAALRHLTRAADLAPEDPIIQMHLGHAFARRGTHAFAEQAFANALRLRPDLHQVRPLLGELLLKSGRSREAEPHYRALLAEPAFAVAGHIGLADVARAENRLEDAVAGYRSALELDPRQSLPVRALAWTLSRIGRNDQAIATYDSYLAQVPDDHPTLTARADLLMLIGRLPEAATAWRALSDGNPGDMQARSRLAMLDEHLGRFDAALAEADLVLRAQPQDAEMLLIRTRRHLREHDDGAANTTLEALAAQPLSEGQGRLLANYRARIHDRAGNFADAARGFAQAQRGMPMNLPALDDPHASLAEALAEPVGADWADAPVLLLGTPGSGVERVAALLADQPGLIVLRDRIGAMMRVDDFNQPMFAHYTGALGADERDALRERYLAPLRTAQLPPGRTVVDWLPRWDAHLLALVRRAMPGTRLIVVERDPRDALLNWLAFGWAQGFGCADVDTAAGWLVRAQKHLRFGAELDAPRRITVAADPLLEDAESHGVELARFLGLDALTPGPQLAAMASVLGGLPARFPAGHWRGYATALAAPFQMLE